MSQLCRILIYVTSKGEVFGVAWNYTPFHQGSIAAIKFSRNSNEAAVTLGKWRGYFLAACGLSTGSTTTSTTRGLMATTTWTTTMGGWSE